MALKNFRDFRHGRHGGEVHFERGPLIDLSLHINGAAMALNDPQADRETRDPTLSHALSL